MGSFRNSCLRTAAMAAILLPLPVGGGFERDSGLRRVSTSATVSHTEEGKEPIVGSFTESCALWHDGTLRVVLTDSPLTDAEKAKSHAAGSFFVGLDRKERFVELALRPADGETELTAEKLESYSLVLVNYEDSPNNVMFGRPGVESLSGALSEGSTVTGTIRHEETLFNSKISCDISFDAVILGPTSS